MAHVSVDDISLLAMLFSPQNVILFKLSTGTGHRIEVSLNGLALNNALPYCFIIRLFDKIILIFFSFLWEIRGKAL